MTPMPVELADAVMAASELVEPALRKAVSRLDPPLQRLCSYHLGWADRDGAPASGTAGKALRPTLTLLSARAAHGDPAAAVPAAVGVELVHNFSLVHDDVMDGDAQRRHQPTVWAEFGIPAAVLAGDAMLGLALDVVLSQDLADAGPRVAACLVGALNELIAGQSADLDFEHRTDVTLPEGVAMADGKTAALLRCSAAVGALAVAAEPTTTDRLAAFGQHLGAAFQLVDDLLGIWGASEVTGKPAMADLLVRKKSLPVLAALSAPCADGIRLRQEYGRAEPFGPDELPRLAELVERAGGREWAKRRAEHEIAQAHRCLDGLDAEPADRAALLALSDYVAGRDR